MYNTDNIRIKDIRPLISPGLLLEEIPLTEQSTHAVNLTRQAVADILHGKDPRLVVVVGPCSIHDPDAAYDYARKLKGEIDKYQDDLCIIMRVYFEKPRTTVGWKGLINDPNLDSSFDINKGLRSARQLLQQINHLGVPTGSEFLDTIIPQYISDLTSWAAIGARTTESQIHRELASGLSMPVGFKNGTSGNVQIAVDAVYAAQQPHNFLGVSKQGLASIVGTQGNPNCHIILRGASDGPNYSAKNIGEAVTLLEKRQLTPRLMVDCSHGNSQKDHTKQMSVLNDLCQQIQNGSQAIMGVMLESNLIAGNQKIVPDKELAYGQSITDACIGWEETQQALALLSATLRQLR